MNIVSELLQRRCIIKSENKELYYRVKDGLSQIQKIMKDKFGYSIIVNPILIKLEKIPGEAQPWMGIQEFQSIREYQMFCYLLMFLEDKDREYQFVLSTLTQYIQLQFPKGEIDWLNYRTRRQLVRVMKYALDQHLLIHNDGDEDVFSKDVSGEVLYENTGVSRYFMRNFTRELSDFQAPQDFGKSEWIDIDEDRGVVRKHRIYRRLLLSHGMYRKQQDEDFAYVRNYRNSIAHDFESLFPCEFHLHRSSAFITLLEEGSFGKCFPFRNTISDCILLIHSAIVHNVKSKQWQIDEFECITIPECEFEAFCQNCLKKYMEYYPKQYQVEGIDVLVNTVMDAMYSYKFIIREEEQVKILPIVGKIGGVY